MKMLRLFLVLTLGTGLIYPQVVTITGLALYPEESSGSLIRRNGKVIGSELLAQAFTQKKFFHPRPSASGHMTLGSSASHASPTNNDWRRKLEFYRSKDPDAGVDSWTASGSGLDPHISPQTAFAQIKTVAAARTISSETLRRLVERHIEGPLLGIWGQPRVNVLKLNLSLEDQDKNGNTR